MKSSSIIEDPNMTLNSIDEYAEERNRKKTMKRPSTDGETEDSEWEDEIVKQELGQS
jgi:hypothetical protein